MNQIETAPSTDLEHSPVGELVHAPRHRRAVAVPLLLLPAGRLRHPAAGPGPRRRLPRVGRRRQGIPGPARRHRRQRPRPRPPLRDLGDLQPARHPGPRLQLLHEPHPDRAGREAAGTSPRRRPAPRCSSPTPAPKPSRPPSSWRGGTTGQAGRAAGIPVRKTQRSRAPRSSRSKAPSTAAPWAPSRSPPRRPTGRRSPRCPAASCMSRSATSTPSAPPWMRPPPPSSSNRSRARPASARCPPATCKAAREATSAAGALLILDEVQTGIGRTGKWLASEDAGIVPDAVTLAKGLGGGFPIGALVTFGPDTSALLTAGQHGTTFGGNPVATAAALATLHVLENQRHPGPRPERGGAPARRPRRDRRRHRGPRRRAPDRLRPRRRRRPGRRDRRSRRRASSSTAPARTPSASRRR